jgi:hypothetical protein
MGKTPEEIQQELEQAKQAANTDANRRKIMYCDVEAQIIAHEKKLEAIKLFISIVQKYNISSEDIVILVEQVPFL